ncbi:16S rRNA (cytidine(1402)-2'-O)-methyltransferase [uncultured Aurantimicrobium sp.]|uniref:16S rRNA (cytidine(1402)-2'-O)-methyltransferase n=1 Tax=uncultured Aurantimicrobium sp. TaxID=1705357 RepID=UPI0026186F7A|nr:16S rRNA (cytidine(1402)-2'-O)-methyltransferase [uncultured Aurantimicrobium sp.]
MIILAATPIGNLGDASTRLVEALTEATVIASEDTRTTSKLLNALGIENRPRLIALHDHNESTKSPEIIELAKEGNVLVLSDAGMPTVSDPGFHLVEAAAAAGVQVTAIPGPSAVITALAVAGLPTDRFTFEGFLPRKQGERKATFRALARESRTMVFFESPNRIAESLADARDELGAERSAAVCRELTKFYEEVKRGSLSDLADWAADGVRGEIVLVIGGATAATLTLEDGLVQVQLLVADGMRLKEASTQVAEETGLSKRELYQAALAAK